jgi:hypothetical protein
MSQLFRRFLGLIVLIATVGLATCQSMVKADAMPIAPNQANRVATPY